MTAATPGTTRPSSGRPRTGVPAAALALVLAVWGALALAPTRDPDATASMGSGASGIALPAAPAGFRADAWYLPDDPRLGFVEIPAGPFVMGSDPGVDPQAFDVEWWGEGRVQGVVDLPTYHLGRFEVTVAQFIAFVADSGHPVHPEALRAALDHPVTMVSWTDAVAYARWLDGRLRDGAASVPDEIAALLREGWRVTLPTEAQWEKAARGGDARIYPWGDVPRRDRAHWGADAPRRVGADPCPECPYAVLDLSGNVWEWTRSPYQPYPYDEADDREGLGAEALWVMRGGSFADGPRFIRGANRGGADPGARRPFIGFRVALGREAR